MRLIVPTLVAVLFVSTAALNPLLAQPMDCRNASSQTDMTMCAGQGLRQADTALNRTYATVMRRLSPTGKSALREAQRAWLAYRDKECFFESNGNDGGSVAPMIASNCAQALTDHRTKELTRFKVCREGDLSCPN